MDRCATWTAKSATYVHMDHKDEVDIEDEVNDTDGRVTVTLDTCRLLVP